MVTRVTFLGWEHEETRKKFFGSVGFYEQELQTGRAQPRTPPYLFYMKGIARRELPNVGTPPGSELEFCFNPKQLSDERIREYFREIGLRVEEGSWHVVKDKPPGWFIGVC